MRARLVLIGTMLAGVALSSCGGPRDHGVNEQRSWIPRRTDVPFSEAAYDPGNEVLAASRSIDDLERLFNEGRDGEVRTRLKDYFAHGGDHPRAHDLNGRMLWLEARYTAAAEAFARAIAGSPRWAVPRLRLADCYVKLDRLAAASSVYQDIDRLAPEAPWGPWGMGVLTAQRGDLDQGATLLDEALHRDPGFAPALAARASLAKLAGDSALESRLLELYAVQTPDDPQARYRLGELAESADRLVDAIRHFSDAYALAPDPRTARRIVEIAERRKDGMTADQWRPLAGGGAPKAVKGGLGGG